MKVLLVFHDSKFFSAVPGLAWKYIGEDASLLEDNVWHFHSSGTCNCILGRKICLAAIPLFQSSCIFSMLLITYCDSSGSIKPYLKGDLPRLSGVARG